MVEKIIEREERKNRDPFIEKIMIENGEDIEIPDGSVVYKTKKGSVYFYYGIPEGSNNNFKEIPIGYEVMNFPWFKRNMHNIEYGKPMYRR